MPAIANTLIVDNTFTIDNNTIDVSQADLTFSIDASYIVDISGTGALRIPVGTTGERPVMTGSRSDYIGCIRYNTSEDSSGAEIYDKYLQWVPLGSGGGGGGGGGGGINEDIQTVDFELDFDNKDKGFINIYTKAPKYKTVSFLENVDILSGDITSYIISNDGSSNNKIKLTFGEPVEPLWIKGGGTTEMAHSVDGINWNNVSVTNAPLTRSYTIMWNGFIWVAGGTGSSYSIAWSEDGTNWTGASHSMSSVKKVEWNGSKWVAVGAPTPTNAGETNGITIQYSYDGKTWNDVANSTNNFSNHGNTVVWIDYASIWIAGGDGSNNQIAISTDGVSWTNKEGGMGTSGNTPNQYCLNIGWNDNIIIACGGHAINEIAYSQDNGSTWTLVTSITGNPEAVKSQPIWNGNMWTAGASGFAQAVRLVYSYDGKNWTATYSGFGNHGYTTSWNGDRWVAGGVGSSIAISAGNFNASDGSSWTGGFGTGIFSNCYYIEWTGKYFIARSDGSNDMIYSYDGITWTGSGSFNTSYQDAFAFNTARANQITFDSNGDPTVTIHKPLTNVSTLEFALEYENQPAVSNVNVTIKVPVSGSGGGGGDIGDFIFDGSMVYIPSGSMNINAPDGNINLEADNNITIRANNSAIDLSADNVYGGIPIGGIILWSGKQSTSAPNVPDGWQLCDGTNNTPDLRGRFVVGYNSDDPSFNEIDASGGEKEHTLTVDEMPSHGHSITDPGHLHNQIHHTASPGSVTIVPTLGEGSYISKYGDTPSVTTGITIDPSGGGQPHNNLPPYYVLAYIMRIR